MGEDAVEATGVDGPAAGPDAARGRTSLSDHPTVIVATLVVAIIGAVTGTYGLISDRRVDVHLSVRYGQDQRPWTLQIGMVNTSNRGVSILGGTLLLDGAPAARVDRILASVPDPSDPRHDADVLQGALPLPYSAAPGESLAGTVVFRPVPGHEDEDGAALARFNDLMTSPPELDVGSHVLELQLVLEPGGTVTERVEPPPEGVGVRTELTYAEVLPGWHPWLVIDERGSVTELGTTGPRGRLGVAVLELWRGDEPEALLRIRRPLLDRIGTAFPVGGDAGLPDGAYRWVLQVDGESVGAGAFSVPCPDRDRVDAGAPTRVPIDACTTG